MMNLVIDIGNSSMKAGLFNNRELIRTAAFDIVSPASVESFLAGASADFIILSSVRGPQPELENYLGTHEGFIRFHTGLKSMLKTRYKTPETLGPDRLAAVIGAVSRYPGQDVLVIDAGTCITYDFADRELTYHGGSISPGISMRFQALHHYTGKLPLITADGQFTSAMGDDTRSAILSGVQQGAWYELLGHIGSYRSLYPNLQVVLCGGDAPFFESRLKMSIFAPIVKTEPHLVLTGLNEVIFQYND